MEWLWFRNVHNFLNIFIALFVAPGLLVTGFGARTVWRDHSSAKWPQTRGTVLSSSVEDNSDSDGSSYKAKVEYRYVVGGTAYVGKRVSFGVDSGSGSQTAAAQSTAKYTVGTLVTVRYRGDRPELCTLEAGLTRRSFVMLSFGVGFTLFALWFRFMAWLMGA